MTDGRLHGRHVTDDVFYEWQLSGHPDARAERDWRRTAHLTEAETDRAAVVRVRADKINAQPDAPHTLRDPAASMGPLPTRPRPAPKAATPNRTWPTSPGYAPQHETSMQASGPPGSWDYRYPGHLTDPGAYSPPPEPSIPVLRGQIRMLNRRLVEFRFNV